MSKESRLVAGVIQVLLLGAFTAIVVEGSTALKNREKGETVLCQVYVWASVVSACFGMAGCALGLLLPGVVETGESKSSSGLIGMAIIVIGGIINYGSEPCHAEDWSDFVMVTWWFYLLCVPVLLVVGMLALWIVFGCFGTRSESELPTQMG
jgi:predicted permease